MHWKEKLKNDFPKMFSELTFGFECGPGWEKLIRKLAEDIQKNCDETGDQVYAFQVKEKYGGLRFYIDGANEDVFNLIHHIARAGTPSFRAERKRGLLLKFLLVFTNTSFFSILLARHSLSEKLLTFVKRRMLSNSVCGSSESYLAR